MINRRNVLISGAATGALLCAPRIARAEARTVTWITHPVIFEATGSGALFADFTAASGIKVEVTTFPTDALAQRIPAEFIAGSNAFDVCSMAESFWTTALSRFVEPLEDWNVRAPLPDGGLADFAPGMVAQFRIPQDDSGTIYGIPHRMSTDILFYRKDLLEQAGLAVPKTLAEYYEVAKALTRFGGNAKLHGAVFQGIQSQQGTLDWYSWAAGRGVNVLVPPDWRRAAFNTPEAAETLDLRRRMIAEGIVTKGALSYSFDDAINAMAQGRAAMSIMFSAYWSRLNDPAISTIVGKVGYAAVPRDPGVERAHFVRGWSILMNKASRNKEAAWEFIRHFTSPDMQAQMAIRFGNPVSRISAAQRADVAAAVPVMPAVADSLPRAKIQPNTPELPRVWEALSLHVSNATAGTVPASEALAAAEAQVNALLG